MKWALKKKQSSYAFTIVELMIVVAVLAILAGVTVVSYGSWQTRLAQNSVQADLKTAAAAMEQAKNFGSGYPLAVPSSFKSGDSVAIAGGGSSDGSSFCLQGGSTNTTGVTYYIDGVNKSPQTGSCPSLGLVGWWPLDGNGNDTSGGGHNGLVVNASPTTDKNGSTNQAYAFNGSNTYIQVPTMSIATTITTSAWVYSANFSQLGFVVGKNPVNQQWEIFFSGALMYWRGGAPYNNNTVCAIPSANNWHHIVGLQDGGNTALYIDGVKCDSDSGSTAIGNGTGTIDIGRYSSGYYFNGKIDDVRLYSRALSDSEVQAIYDAGPQ